MKKKSETRLARQRRKEDARREASRKRRENHKKFSKSISEDLLVPPTWIPPPPSYTETQVKEFPRRIIIMGIPPMIPVTIAEMISLSRHHLPCLIASDSLRGRDVNDVDFLSHVRKIIQTREERQQIVVTPFSPDELAE